MLFSNELMAATRTVALRFQQRTLYISCLRLPVRLFLFRICGALGFRIFFAFRLPDSTASLPHAGMDHIGAGHFTGPIEFLSTSFYLHGVDIIYASLSSDMLCHIRTHQAMTTLIEAVFFTYGLRMIQ